MSGAQSYKTTELMPSARILEGWALGAFTVHSHLTSHHRPLSSLISQTRGQGLSCYLVSEAANGVVVMLALCGGHVVSYCLLAQLGLWSPPSWWSLTLGERCPPTVQQFLEDKLVTDLA